MPRKFIFGNRAIVATNRAGGAVNVGPAMNLAGGTVNIMVWGEISEWWGVNSRDVYWALKGQNISQINVFISSPGGEIDQSFVIHDMLLGHPANVTAYLVGQCASAATIIACAANTTIMSNQCIYMIHKPQWGLWGDADALKKAGEILDKYQDLIVNVYKRKTKMDEDTLNVLMNAETWFEPSEALALGFVDQVVDNIEVDFLLPTAGADPLTTGDSDAFDNVSTYRVAALNALEKGLRPANQADIRNIVSRKSTNNNMKSFFKSVMNFLVGASALAADVDIDKLAEDLAADKDLANELQTDAIREAVREEVKNQQATALTLEGFLGVINGAKPEDKAKIAAALNLQAPEPPKNEGKEAGKNEADELRTQIEDLKAEIANLKKPGGSQASTNGGSSIKDTGKGKTKDERAAAARKEIALNSFQNGSITAAQYERITGEQPPRPGKGA